MNQDDARDRALAAARQVWGSDWTPSSVSRAPGRLELLGNHVDYNGGPVLAAAIDRDAVCVVRDSREPGVAVILADIAPQPAKLDPATLGGWRKTDGSPEPLDYVRGVIATALDRGERVPNGVQVAVAGDVPIGFGLSSSAALCVALTQALHLPAPANRDLVLRAQAAEHRAGTPCGTMDQSASVGGNVILYDGATVSWQVIAPDLRDFVFAVADSGVARSLATSSYPRRVDESREALRAANSILGTSYDALAKLSMADLERLESTASTLSPVLERRVRHVVLETARVAEGAEAMRAGDWPRFGVLMTASGHSSAIDYEISHPSVEEIVSIAQGVRGVAGARMMGGGEGGAALVLVERAGVPALIDALERGYYRHHPVDNPEPVRVFRFAPGASVDVT